jgi:hypothetical protein
MGMSISGFACLQGMEKGRERSMSAMEIARPAVIYYASEARQQGRSIIVTAKMLNYGGGLVAEGLQEELAYIHTNLC